MRGPDAGQQRHLAAQDTDAQIMTIRSSRCENCWTTHLGKPTISSLLIFVVVVYLRIRTSMTEQKSTRLEAKCIFMPLFAFLKTMNFFSLLHEKVFVSSECVHKCKSSYIFIIIPKLAIMS